MKITKTNRTVLFRALKLALVLILHRLAQAAPASITMVIAVLAANSAQATLVTMIDPFLVTQVVVQVADVTEVQGEVFLAALTGFSLCLLETTAQTFDMCDCPPVELVVLFHVEFLIIASFIVAESTWPKLASTDRIRTLFHARTPVMLTSKLTLLLHLFTVLDLFFALL
jgi:hypothetical protein